LEKNWFVDVLENWQIDKREVFELTRRANHLWSLEARGRLVNNSTV